jgi:hypothetical protein
VRAELTYKLEGAIDFDLAPDGKRLVVLTPVETPGAPHADHNVVFLQNFSTSCAASCQWANDLSLSDFAKRAWSSEAVAVYREPTSLAATKSPPTVSFPASEPRAELVLPCREAYFDRLGHDGKPHRRISRLTSRSAAIGSTWRFDFRELFSRNSGESFYARSDSYCSSHPAMVLSPG